MEFSFPVGYHQFHTVKIINFQLNRWHSLGYARFEDLLQAAQRIRTLDDWKGVMVSLAQEAESEQRWMNAAFYYRAAEFFTLPSDPDKEVLYNRFIDIFYQKVFAGESFKRFLVPYEHTHLPAICIPSALPESKGTIVIHGGFDSFIEEFYSLAVYFSNQGYDSDPVRGTGTRCSIKKIRPSSYLPVGKTGEGNIGLFSSG